MPPSILLFGRAPSNGSPALSAAPAAGLFCKDVGVHARRRSRTAFGFQKPLPVALFQQIYPAAEGHFLGDLEQPIATTDLMPFGELAESELYRQWARAPGPGRFPERGRRQDDRQRRHFRSVPPRAERRRRRPGAPANEVDRAAYQARRADWQNVRVQGRRKSRPSSIRSMGSVRACISSMRTGVSFTPMPPAMRFLARAIF